LPEFDYSIGHGSGTGLQHYHLAIYFTEMYNQFSIFFTPQLIDE